MIDHYSRYFEELGEMPTQRKHSILLHRLNLESLLSRLDSSTMLAGLEARVPYTDHLLVEKMFAVPNKCRIDVAHDERAPYLASAELESRGSIRSKRLLRTIAERLMPADLAHRKKASFPTPVQRWLSALMTSLMPLPAARPSQKLMQAFCSKYSVDCGNTCIRCITMQSKPA